MSRVVPFRLAVASMVLMTAVAGAQQPPGAAGLSWADLLDCELVVAGRYQSHQGGTLSLEIVEVLRGKGCKAGDVLPVKLSQAFVIQFSPRYGDPKRPKAQIPRITFSDEQGDNVVEVPVAYDAERVHVYFFPKENRLFVGHPTQVQLDRRTGWKQALAGQPIELSFRLLHDLDSDMSRQAIVELYKSRDRNAIAALVDVMGVPLGPRWMQEQAFAERALITLGDKDGDLHEPVLKVLLDGGNYADDFRLARILARGDSKRALADFRKMLQPGSRVSRNGIVWGMHNLETEEGLDFMLELLVAGRPHTLESLRCLMHNEQPLAVPMVKRARVQELAVPKLQKILKSGVLTKEQQGWASFHEYFRSLTHVIPEDELLRYKKFYAGGNHPARKKFPDWDRLVYEAMGYPEPLLKADLVEGRKLLRALFAKPDPAWRVTPAILQSLAHHYGDQDMARRHKKPADPIVRYRDANAAYYHWAPFSEFMKMFKQTRKLSDAYWAQSAALFPDHADEYFHELVALIESKEESRRHFAIVQQLQNHFFWNFDLDPQDFPPVIERKLKEIKPLLARMSQGDLLHMRATVLKHFGVELNGPPGKGWLPAVHAGCLSWNPTIKLNALHVLGMLEEDSEITLIANYPVVQRRDALEAHLKRNRDKLQESPILPVARMQELWNDLASDNRAKAYAAMQVLAQVPRSTTPWLRKNLKEVGADRMVRAVQVLEYSPGPKARALLEELAAGPKELPATHEAQGALRRLHRYWRW